MSKPIDRFTGYWAFLSNFHPSPVTYQLLTYPTVENAFQAAKINPLMPWKRIPFTQYTASEAKKRGRGVTLRKNWEQIKDAIMFNLLLLKFTTHPTLREALLDTKDRWLIEGNTWHDNYWGVCTCLRCNGGKNTLGELLIRVREAVK